MSDDRHDVSMAYQELLAGLEYMKPSTFAAHAIKAERARLRVLVEGMHAEWCNVVLLGTPTCTCDAVNRESVLKLLEGEPHG